MVDAGHSLALLDEADLKLQAEQAEAEFTAASGVLVQAAASERRATELQGQGLDHRRAAGPGACGRR